MEIIPYRIAYVSTRLARTLGVEPGQIHHAARTGMLQGRLTGDQGGRTLILGDSVQQWLERGSPRYAEDPEPLGLAGFTIGSPEPNRLAYTLRRAATVVSLSPSYLIQQISLYYLEAKRVGKRYVIPAESLTRWLNRLDTADGSYPVGSMELTPRSLAHFKKSWRSTHW